MKIAIIGGGGAGMICAYLLDKAGHQITVLEKQDKLGGNIRTTNKNVLVPGLEKELFLEGGVVEFSGAFKRFQALMKELDVELIPIPIGTALFLKNGKSYLSQILTQNNRKGLQRLIAYTQFFGLQLTNASTIKRVRDYQIPDLKHVSIKDFLQQDNIGATWMKNCTMYSFSIPFEQVDAMPAELGIPSFAEYQMAGWHRIQGGVYTYIEQILARFSGQIICEANVNEIHRHKEGVNIQWNDGKEETFDKLVFATPPDQVLQLLSDPTAAESRRFNNWKANYAQTIIHHDNAFYEPYQITHPSPFDFFETPSGWGYNAYLNDLCNITSNTPYFLAYNMRDLIDPTKIIHVQDHHTPLYTVGAFRYRDEVINTNGENHTYHAGAYLSDGLHEGAVVSAERVVDLLR